MIPVEQARAIVLQHAKPLPTRLTAIDPVALGYVIAESVTADIDSPPFPKALMDGYAVIANDLANGPVELAILEEVQAGAMPSQTVTTGKCVGIFTGAPMPVGADCVVMKERCEVLSTKKVKVNDPSLKPGKNCLDRGQEMKVGDVIVRPGEVITPQMLGVVASVGKPIVSVYRRPVLCILATGNELVEANVKPSGGQIRNSNGPMLMAQATQDGAEANYLGIATDDKQSLKSMIKDGLGESDILVLAGGVSAGKFDLVPEVLESLGVTIHFHHVKMKPGKPLLFGTLGDKLIFGLPGNPVSSFVGFELFVKPAIQTLMGRLEVKPEVLELPLMASLQAKHDRPTYHPARLTRAGVLPLPWFGSADLRGLLNVNGFILLPAGEVSYPQGQSVPVMVIA